MKLDYQKIAKELLSSLTALTEEDVKHWERTAKLKRECSAEEVKHLLSKANKARKLLAMMKRLTPDLLKMLEPPKPYKVPKMTKKRLAEIRKQYPNYPESYTPAAVPAAPVRSH